MERSPCAAHGMPKRLPSGGLVRGVMAGGFGRTPPRIPILMLAWAEPLVWRFAALAALVAVVFAGSWWPYARQPQPITPVWLEERGRAAAFSRLVRSQSRVLAMSRTTLWFAHGTFLAGALTGVVGRRSITNMRMTIGGITDPRDGRSES